MKRVSRIVRRNEWREEYRKNGTPWVSTLKVEAEYQPNERAGKTYQPNGEREVARRRRQREAIEARS